MLRTIPSQGMHGPGLTAISFFVKRISRELMSELFLKTQEPIKTTGKYSTGSLMFQYILINLERNQRTKCTLCPNIVQVSYELNLTGFESHSSPDCLRSPPSPIPQWPLNISSYPSVSWPLFSLFITQTLFCMHCFQKTIPDGLSHVGLGRLFFCMYFYHIFMFYNQTINSRMAETLFSLRVEA